MGIDSNIIKINRIYRKVFMTSFKKLILKIKNELLKYIVIGIIGVFTFTGLMVAVKEYSVQLSDTGGLIVVGIILLKIYHILCGIFKTNLCINSKEEYYILSFFSNKSTFLYKICGLIIKTIVLNSLFITVYYYITGAKINLQCVFFIIVISIFSELMNALVYKTQKIYKYIEIIYFLFILVILGLGVVIANNLNIIQFLNFNVNDPISKNIFLSIGVLGTLIDIFLIKQLIKNNNIEKILFYGNIKYRINLIYKNLLLGIDSTSEAQLVNRNAFADTAVRRFKNFYKIGWFCLVFKNLKYISSKNVVQIFYSSLDILIISAIIAIVNNKIIVIVAIIFLINLVNTKTTLFFSNDIKNRELNKCIPLKDRDFLKGYLLIPMISNIIYSLYIIGLLIIKFEFRFIESPILGFGLFIILNIGLVLNQINEINNVINKRSLFINIINLNLVIGFSMLIITVPKIYIIVIAMGILIFILMKYIKYLERYLNS